jgi:hypothetical protein
MRELFIYYRLQINHVADAATLQTQVAKMQNSLQFKHRGLQARLLKRFELVDEWQTWMETYAWPENPCGVSEALQAEIETAAAVALEGWPTLLRHMEVFTSCAL